MELKTSTQISKHTGLSSRMLRYYEKAGLIQSTHIKGYAYRMYDETEKRKLQLDLLFPIKEKHNV